MSQKTYGISCLPDERQSLLASRLEMKTSIRSGCQHTMRQQERGVTGHPLLFWWASLCVWHVVFLSQPSLSSLGPDSVLTITCHRELLSWSCLSGVLCAAGSCNLSFIWGKFSCMICWRPCLCHWSGIILLHLCLELEGLVFPWYAKLPRVSVMCFFLNVPYSLLEWFSSSHLLRLKFRVQSMTQHRQIDVLLPKLQCAVVYISVVEITIRVAGHPQSSNESIT